MCCLWNCCDSRLSVKFIMATNSLLVSSDHAITKLAGTTCSLGHKPLVIRWQALHVAFHFIYFLIYLTPARHVHVRRDGCMHLISRSFFPACWARRRCVTMNDGTIFSQNSNQMLDPYAAESLHTHGVQPSYNKAKLSRLIASRMTYSTWTNEVINHWKNVTNVFILREECKLHVSGRYMVLRLLHNEELQGLYRHLVLLEGVKSRL